MSTNYNDLFTSDDSETTSTPGSSVSREQDAEDRPGVGPTIESDQDLAEFIADVKDVPVDAALQVLEMLDEAGAEGGDVTEQLAQELREEHLSDEEVRRLKNLRNIQREFQAMVDDTPSGPSLSQESAAADSSPDAEAVRENAEDLGEELDALAEDYGARVED